MYQLYKAKNLFFLNYLINNLSSLRYQFVFILLFLIISKVSFAQNDSDKIKIGPEELQISKGGHYFNFADKNKVNIEVTLLGLGAGKYLIPQGTTLFDFLIMAGGTASKSLEDVKVVRFRSETPRLQGKDVLQYEYDDLYGDKEEILRSHPNPMLRPGDMIIIPEEQAQSIFYYIRETILFIGTLVSFYYLIDNIIRRN